MTRTLQDAIESGELSQSQLRELIAEQARELDLSFDQAVAAARAGTLPRSALGSDLALLVRLLLRQDHREAV